MQGFIKGAIFGGAIVASALVGHAYGVSEDSITGEFERGRCEVRVGYGRRTPGDECRFDQVMVGIRNEYLLCADLDVSCD